MPQKFRILNQEIIDCQQCPRLIEHCQAIGQSKRKAYQDQDYWAKPVPNLGTLPASLLLVGLAPGAHGANRTGRMFTGDESGRWLFRALHRAGFANQSTWQANNDGLKLLDCAITAVNHCAPPDNKPTPLEMAACTPFLAQTIQLCKPRVILALGQIAWSRTWRQLNLQTPLVDSERKPPVAKHKFAHGLQIQWPDGRWLLGSYHPSQQNTFTGRLTENMLDSVFSKARDLLTESASQ